MTLSEPYPSSEGRDPPAPDADSADFWSHLRTHRIVLQQCVSCREVHFPPMPGCPSCGSVDTTDLLSDGGGRIYSWVVAHRAVGNLVEADLPYTIATIELDVGCRMLGRVIGDPRRLAVDVRVCPHFIDHPAWTELAFALIGGH